ncbi:MAG: hypothetical protein ACOCVF_03620 [bacterium]
MNSIIFGFLFGIGMLLSLIVSGSLVVSIIIVKDFIQNLVKDKML